MPAVDTVRLCCNASPLSSVCTFLNLQFFDTKVFLLHQCCMVTLCGKILSPPELNSFLLTLCCRWTPTVDHQKALYYGKGGTI